MLLLLVVLSGVSSMSVDRGSTEQGMVRMGLACHLELGVASGGGDYLGVVAHSVGFAPG